MRRPPLEQFIAAGRLPAALTSKMLSVAKGAANGANESDIKAEMMKLLTPDEILENLSFGCELLEYAAVEPRIVVKPGADGQIPPDAILPTDILPEDFQFLVAWVFGGDAGASLNKFS